MTLTLSIAVLLKLLKQWDVLYIEEVALYERVSYNTKYMRHYYIRRLLRQQLKEFNHGEGN